MRDAHDFCRDAWPSLARTLATYVGDVMWGEDLLGDDHRVQLFVERSIGLLLAHDARQGTSLLESLRAYLECGGNTSSAARRVGLSRPGLYARLATVQRLLGSDITQPTVRTSLHAALMAWDAGTRHGSTPTGG